MNEDRDQYIEVCPYCGGHERIEIRLKKQHDNEYSVEKRNKDMIIRPKNARSGLKLRRLYDKLKSELNWEYIRRIWR